MRNLISRPGVITFMGFSLASILGWGAAYVVVFVLGDHMTVADTASAGAVYVQYFREGFILFLGSFVFGAMGASVRLHLDSTWGENGDDVITDYGQLSIGAIFGIFAAVALDAGLLNIFISVTDFDGNAMTVSPSAASQVLFAFLFGMFAAEIYRTQREKFKLRRMQRKIDP
ncbi:MAG: hypothetical protein ACWA40_00380 [Planktomarina sp.]